MSAAHNSRERDLAFLEDLNFMLNMGESKTTAARRLGLTDKSLEQRVLAAKKRLRGGPNRGGIAGKSGKMTGSNKSGAEGSYHLDADPLTDNAESRTA
jgi:hypothetical protein